MMSTHFNHADEALTRALQSLLESKAIGLRWYSKAEIVALLSRFDGLDAEGSFAKIRVAARSATTLGEIKVFTMGQKRGTRYAFGDEPTRALAPGEPEVAPRRARILAPPHGTSLDADRDAPAPGNIRVIHADNLAALRKFRDGSFDLIYIDPPFNTGHVQSRTRIKTVRDDEGDRTGYQGKRYRTTVVGQSSYRDSFDDYLAFLMPRLEEAYRLLADDGSFFLHLDYREVHYAKVALDQIFGRQSFINEIIWAYDYGARATNRWSPKHDNILWYAKNPSRYCFNFDEMDRIPYMAPDLVGEEKAARGKTPTDTWWHTIVSPNGKEKTGYPTQKPLGVLTRLVRVHSKPGDKLLDFFAGSGSFGDAAARFGRDVVLIDESDEAIAVMQRRFSGRSVTFEDEAGDPIVPATGRHSSVGAHDEVSASNAVNGGHDGASADVDGTGHVDQAKVQHDPRAVPVIPVETSAADGAAAGAPSEQKENRPPSRLATRGNPEGAQGSLF